MAWLLGSFSVPLTAAQLVEASGIRNILSSGPGKIFLCGFCGEKKKSFKDSMCVCVCVLHIIQQIFSKTLELTKIDFILETLSVIYDGDFL